MAKVEPILQRIEQFGASHLSDQELLSMLLRPLSRRSSCQVAADLLQRFEDLPGVLHSQPRQWQDIEGIGAVKYWQLQAMGELVRRMLTPQLNAQPVLDNVRLTADFIRLSLRYEYECFGLLLLNNQHQLIAWQEVFRGTINAAPVYPREIVKLCLHNNAAALILAHNHPSGILSPSEADKAITQQIQQACRVIDVRVLDHFIVSRQGYFSFAEAGIL